MDKKYKQSTVHSNLNTLSSSYKIRWVLPLVNLSQFIKPYVKCPKFMLCLSNFYYFLLPVGLLTMFVVRFKTLILNLNFSLLVILTTYESDLLHLICSNIWTSRCLWHTSRLQMSKSQTQDLLKSSSLRHLPSRPCPELKGRQSL